MRLVTVLGLTALLVILCVAPLAAQSVLPAKAGMISYIEGDVFLGDKPVEITATKLVDVNENAVVRTTEGRAEILLTPGVMLHLGENSSFRMISRRLVDTRLELLQGSAVLDAEQIAPDTAVTVISGEATVSIPKAGHYRFDSNPALIKVFAGLASVEIGGNTVQVHEGKMLTLGSTTASVEKFDREDTDSLDNWARRRGQTMAVANVATARSLRYGYLGSGGAWAFNPYFGMYTYIPGSGRYCDPFYGVCYWSPYTVGRVYYQPPPMNSWSGSNGGFGGASYPTMAPTSSGYSGTIASSPSVASSPAAVSSSGSSAASSAGAASVGHGGGASGGHGK